MSRKVNDMLEQKIKLADREDVSVFVKAINVILISIFHMVVF